MLNKKQVGRFWISKHLIENYPEDISNMFQALGIVVLRAEMIYQKDAIEYVGYSPYFEETEPYLTLQDYEIEVHLKDGEKSYSVKKWDVMQNA